MYECASAAFNVQGGSTALGNEIELIVAKDGFDSCQGRFSSQSCCGTLYLGELWLPKKRESERSFDQATLSVSSPDRADGGCHRTAAAAAAAADTESRRYVRRPLASSLSPATGCCCLTFLSLSRSF